MVRKLRYIINNTWTILYDSVNVRHPVWVIGPCINTRVCTFICRISPIFELTPVRLQKDQSDGMHLVFCYTKYLKMCFQFVILGYCVKIKEMMFKHKYNYKTDNCLTLCLIRLNTEPFWSMIKTELSIKENCSEECCSYPPAVVAHNENETAFIIEAEVGTAPRMLAAATAPLINALILKIISKSQRGTLNHYILQRLCLRKMTHREIWDLTIMCSEIGKSHHICLAHLWVFVS